MDLPPIDSRKRTILVFSLLFGGCGWGISVFFLIGSWEDSTQTLYFMGADVIEYQPLLNYWLKMAAAAFTFIGLMFFWGAWKPQKFQHMNLLLGWFSLFVGVVLAVSAVAEGLTPLKHKSFTADIIFCFLVAAGVLGSYCGNKAD